MSKEKAITELRGKIAEFKEDLANNGWEEHEMDEKVAEVLERFPWYKYKKVKKTWKSKFIKFCLISILVYFGIGALLQRNRRMKKNINDYIFDLQLPYQQNRIFRFLTLPIFKYYDLSKFHSSECLVHNPFLSDDILKCEFCEKLISIPIVKSKDIDIYDIAIKNEIVTIHDVPGYSNSTYGFNDFQDLFNLHGKNLDESICKKYNNKNNFIRISDFFKLSEKEINEKNITLGWRNCDAYGTRFYRKLFPRPEFISNMSEILLEKDMYFLQPRQNVTFEKIGGESIYVYQVQGETEYQFNCPIGCITECEGAPLNVTLKPGQILVYPNSDWKVSLKVLGPHLTILYFSAFEN